METEEAEQNQVVVENVSAEQEHHDADDEMEEDEYALPNPDLVNIPSKRPRVYMTRMEFPETVLDDFPVDELLHSAHPREMMPLFFPDVPRGGPLFNPREHKQLFFGVNPYE